MKKVSIVLFVIFSLFYNGCGDVEISSAWRKQNIVIDGDDKDWNNSLTPLGKIDATVGIANDNENLYICLSTDDPGVVNKILTGGLTLWFQGNDKNEGKLGICFPMGMNDTTRPQFDENMKPGDRPADHSKMQQTLLKNQTDLEIINTNNNRIRITVSELKDIQIKLSLNDGKLVYEMKMPLNQRNSTTYALNANAGSNVKIGIESGIIGPGRRANSMAPPDGGFDIPPGAEDGPGGGPDGGPGGGGFPPGGMGRKMFSSRPINFWITVRLASEK